MTVSPPDVPTTPVPPPLLSVARKRAGLDVPASKIEPALTHPVPPTATIAVPVADTGQKTQAIDDVNPKTIDDVNPKTHVARKNSLTSEG